MSDLWISALVSLLIAAGGVAGTMYATRAARAQAAADRAQAAQVQQSTDRNQNYDQLQEDLREVREELDRVNARAKAREERDDRKMRWQSAVNRVLDDEVNDLRKTMAAAGLDVPQRKPLPVFPGDWSVTETP